MTETVSLTQSVPAPPDVAFRAFVAPFMLKQWLCDDCKVDQRVHGKFFLTWNSGDHAVGEYTALEEWSHLAFDWQDKGETGVSHVDVRLSAEGDGTRIDLTHSGITADAPGVEIDWRNGLENLRYLLETGFDYRIMSRPMLGVYPMSNNELGTAKRRGLDTTRGVLLGGVAPGSGAEAAGLQKDDAILRLAGQELTEPTGFAQILAPYKGGDVLDVEILRGGEVKTLQMALTKRPVPPIAATPEALSANLQQIHEEVNTGLEKLIAGVPEDVLKREPAENEWSAYEIIAHLLFTERFIHIQMWALASGDDSVPWNDNNVLQRAPLMALYPTTAEMVEELHRTQGGVVAIAKAIPPDVLKNKVLFTMIALPFGSSDQHALNHLEQIRQTLAVVTPAAA